MRDFDYLTTFILNNDYSKEKIDELKEYLSIKNNKQLIKEAFKFLNTNIGVIENTDFFNEIIPNTVDFIALLCDQEIFNEEQVLVNINRIKKTREALLGNANKYSNDIWLEAANKLDEIITIPSFIFVVILLIDIIISSNNEEDLPSGKTRGIGVNNLPNIEYCGTLLE